jgi:glycosyltransferase involved in cell wall biosynthesis
VHASAEPVTMDTPAVSVCIPVYNGERFIAAALNSALSQTYRDIEIVVVDNASTDATPEIVAGFTDARLRVFRNESNIGAAANFNRAVSRARGRYLKVLCADDVLYPECLAKQVAVLEGDAARGIAVVGCMRDIIDDRGKRWLRRRFPGRSGRTEGPLAIAMTVRSGTNIFGEPAAILARTDAVRAAGAFDTRYGFCLDLDLWCRLLGTGDLYMIEETLCAFRVSSQSWSASLAHRQRREFTGFVEDLRGRGASISALDRVAGRGRAWLNAFFRQGFTRMLLWSSRNR